MKLSIICFSLTGLHTAERLEQAWKRQGAEVLLAKKSKYLEDSIVGSTSAWAGERFRQDDGIVFVGACGIAVRSIAPYVASKKSDPAVLVVDECGTFVISLLSGHLGGANDLALETAKILNAQPVVTTATDLHSRFAVDVFAKKNGCGIRNMKAAKEVSAALLAGKKVGFYSEFPWSGELPEGLVEVDSHSCLSCSAGESAEKLPEADSHLSSSCSIGGISEKQAEVDNHSDSSCYVGESADGWTEDEDGAVYPTYPVGIAVTIHPSCTPFPSTVQIIPLVVTLGMGCRRNKDADGIRKAAETCLSNADIFQSAVSGLASITLKKDEPGLNALAKEWKIPFFTYEPEQLLKAKGDFTPSVFVQSVTGVDNVCERSAVLGADNGTLIQKKSGGDGVTAALALRKWEVHFE